MIVNVYGRHPSIHEAKPTPYDLAISINDTPWPCDWTTFGDPDVLRWFSDGTWERRHRVGLIGPATFEHVHPIPNLGAYRTWQSLHPPFPTFKTGIIALLAALRFGATEVRTWGVRMDGPLDYRGGPSGHDANHTAEQRWAKERVAHARMVAYLDEHGVPVVRY